MSQDEPYRQAAASDGFGFPMNAGQLNGPKQSLITHAREVGFLFLPLADWREGGRRGGGGTRNSSAHLIGSRGVSRFLPPFRLGLNRTQEEYEVQLPRECQMPAGHMAGDNTPTMAYSGHRD